VFYPLLFSFLLKNAVKSIFGSLIEACRKDKLYCLYSTYMRNSIMPHCSHCIQQNLVGVERFHLTNY